MNYLNAQKRYWREGALEDIEVSKELLALKRYLHCLFYANLSLERALKYQVILETRRLPPYSHDLLKLYSLSKSKIPVSIEFLSEINKFNIGARYPEERTKVAKSIDKKTLGDKILQIEKLVFQLCNKKQQ